MPIKCPNCGSSSKVKKHCSSRTCSWSACLCERTNRVIFLVFDRKGRSFLAKDLYSA